MTCGANSEPGEILVWDIVRYLARTPPGVSFEDRGERSAGVGCRAPERALRCKPFLRYAVLRAAACPQTATFGTILSLSKDDSLDKRRNDHEYAQEGHDRRGREHGR